MKLKKFLFVSVLIATTSIFPFFSKLKCSADVIWDDVSFFGDSTTHGMIKYIVHAQPQLGTSYATINRDQILTPPEGTFYLRNLPTTRIQYQDQSFTINDALQRSKPRILIITVGVNGLAHWDEVQFTALYNQLLNQFEQASPRSQLILQSIFPTAKKRAAHLSMFTVDRVDLINSWIQKIADERGLVYINSAEALKGDDGWLRPEYQNGDGLHLNTQGFNCVLKSIENTLIQQKGIYNQQ